MKHLLLLITFLTSVMVFSQNNSSITGTLLDLDTNNAPLEMARIAINETGDSTLTDKNGNFVFENLNAGHYTLAVSFTGYETKTIAIEVLENKTAQIQESLKSRSLSLEDLMLTFASSDNTETTTNR